MTLALPARAKLNLDLTVLGTRADGFHEVRTTLQAIDLHDLLELAPADKTALTTSGIEVSTTKTQTNSILKAHAALEAAAQRDLPTRFHLHKRIPPGAGLGGASSDAAAALRGLAVLHNLSLDLLPIARSLGADVPFFLAGGTAIAEGIGDRLTPQPTEPAWYAIAWPGIELLTADVYRAWDKVKGEPKATNQLTDAATHAEPRLAEFAARLSNSWQMTGSGSAFFLRCISDEQARGVTASIDGWTAVTHAVGPWK